MKPVADLLPLRHIAIIMDGNRRWADKKRLPRLLGHKEGVQALKRLVKHVSKRRLEYMTVYAFSSENWQRGQEEVDYLLKLFAQVLTEELEELSSAGVRLRFIGHLEGMPKNLRDSFARSMEQTKNNKGLNLQVALNYGSRLELSQATKQIAEDLQKGLITAEEITPDLVSSYLYTKGLPDPDLLIRTGGEMRLSNYLLWQAAYTELYVTETMWPDFDSKQFDLAIEEFAQRQRRYGGD
ncbi:MAG: isoprenyl transferase [Candidatus Obscuribacterales bacterium]|nr:isoprenyl transferase [Candidatus Obscuribacterales bacterium]